MPPLPIHTVIPALRSALTQRTAVVLQAPPGAGKTTVVPLALRDESWLAGQRIVMLEPRRLATRAAARYMARSLGESPGQTVGYRVRGESHVSSTTRVEVVTEGILTRRLASDPGLEGVGLVIFDEFHERSVHADLGLALTLQSQAVLREDLRILVMSATLESEALAAMLGDAPVIRSDGRTFPVDTRYLPRRPDARLEQDVALAIRRALTESEGDVLVFLPGAGEIRRVYDLIDDSASSLPTRVFPLYGALP
ncbi:MAG TPA: DEAD/DEAH box helicase, partial [Gemmatimonadaceae bacterium]|nr:DEAD/DEAH box helicase [Gemmatimonadaceae bacterium]